jgi:hypothetical protein
MATPQYLLSSPYWSAPDAQFYQQGSVINTNATPNASWQPLNAEAIAAVAAWQQALAAAIRNRE